MKPIPRTQYHVTVEKFWMACAIDSVVICNGKIDELSETEMTCTIGDHSSHAFKVRLGRIGATVTEV